MKLANDHQRLLKPNEMNDGQVGIIRKHTQPNYLGDIVQRYKDVLISLGMHSEFSYTKAMDIYDVETFGIEILPSGTLLQL